MATIWNLRVIHLRTGEMLSVHAGSLCARTCTLAKYFAKTNLIVVVVSVFVVSERSTAIPKIWVNTQLRYATKVFKNRKLEKRKYPPFLEANASLVVGMSVRQSSVFFFFCPTFHQFLVLSSTVLQFMMLMKVD